jgi:integral membrane protein (TIGR01906 family)
MNTTSAIKKIPGWIITLLVPPILLMMSIRLMISPVFARVEYRLPGFPDDPYGFTLQDRLRWSEPAINYLVNSEDVSYLSLLKFDDGDPVFNERELSHMVDVKQVVTGMRLALAISMLALLALTFFADRRGSRSFILAAYRRGAWVLIGVILTILFFVALSFNNLFTWFHQIFFETGTWQFYTSDTLIRLFPMRFWSDAFILVGLLSMILSGLILLFGREQKSKRIV